MSDEIDPNILHIFTSYSVRFIYSRFNLRNIEDWDEEFILSFLKLINQISALKLIDSEYMSLFYSNTVVIVIELISS